MKNLYKKVIMLLLVVAAFFSMAISASASYEFSLTVGESLDLYISDTPYVSSDPSVVEIRKVNDYLYEAVCVGEGTATVSGGTRMGEDLSDWVFIVTSDEANRQDWRPFAGIGTAVAGGFSIFGILFLGTSAFIVFVFILMFASMQKSKQLDEAMRQLAANPCQQTAEAAVAEFTNINTILRFNLRNGSDTRGVHFTMWKQVFNGIVIPCRQIRTETKEELYHALTRLNTYGLRQVTHIR